MRVLVVHGPNLDRLGSRQPEIYGSQTLADVNAGIEKAAAELGVEVEIHQTAREGEFIELINGTGNDAAIVNPAAYSHTSHAIADAISGAPFPVVEVHISNIHAREEWRRTTITGGAATAVISGLGADGYVAALRWLAKEGS